MDPSPDQFRDSLRSHFAQSVPHVAELGIQVDVLDDRGARATLPYRAAWLGDTERGLIHTGLITSLVDSVSGICVFARLANFEPIATLDLRMDYLRPALRDKALHCHAECYRVSSHIAFVRASVWQDDEQEPIATSQSVFMRASHSSRRARAL